MASTCKCLQPAENIARKKGRARGSEADLAQCGALALPPHLSFFVAVGAIFFSTPPCLPKRLVSTIISKAISFFAKCTVEPVLATTWQKRPPENCGHTISVPWIYGFKCTECVLEIATTWEMRIADTEGRPKALIQPAKRDHIRKIERKTLLWLSNFSFAGTPNERSSCLQECLQAPFGNAPAYMWEPPIAITNVMARAGACVQLHIEIFWTKPGKCHHLKNRTTYSQSLRWS